jgi:hypothetical protein
MTKLKFNNVFMLPLSQLIRNTHQCKYLPTICYAYKYVPKSLSDTCDCVNKCKYKKPEMYQFIKFDGEKKVTDYSYMLK